MLHAKVIAQPPLRSATAASTMRQRCGALKNYWYAAAQADRIGNQTPLGCVILGEAIVLWRDDRGRVAAMSDRCLHRNAKLSEGVLFNGCLSCPYHGWTYDASGACVNIPAEGPHGARPAGLTLESFPVLERDGLVWVWLGGHEAPDKEPFEMPFWNSPEWGSYYMETQFDNAVTPLVENFMDVPHTVFVHRGWFRKRSRRKVGMKVERTSNSVLVTYDQPSDAIGFTGRLLNPRGRPMTHTDRFYMPNITRVDYNFGRSAGFVITSTCTPVGEYKTVVFTLISYKLGALNGLARALLPAYTRKVIQQDVEIMAIQGESLRQSGGPQYTSTPADTLHIHIESLRAHAERGFQGDAPPPRIEETCFWI